MTGSAARTRFRTPLPANRLMLATAPAPLRTASRRLISRVRGSDLRAWIWLVSRISIWPVLESAMYARLPSSLIDMPCEVSLPCQRSCGALGSVTSIAVIDW